MTELRFKEHTEEKLDELEFYYNIWFDIVKRKKTYIIDIYAGTGYNIIGDRNKKVPGSAILAVNLFKKDIYNKLNLILCEIVKDNYNLLRQNIQVYLLKKKLSPKLDKEIIIHNCDWSTKLDEILKSTENGIRLFCIDTANISSIPWEKFLPLLEKGKSEFDHKESGIEIVLNWPWHTIRRKIGRYYRYKRKKKMYSEYSNKGTEKDLKHLDNFFGPIKWQEIADKYPINIFKDEIIEKIKRLGDELLKSYVQFFFRYFKYVKIHSIYERKKTKKKGIKKRGKIKYFLVFVTNYHGAINIIDAKFREYRDKKTFLTPNQTTIDNFISIKNQRKNVKEIENNRFSDKIRNLENELGRELFPKNKKIIKFLYKDNKNYDYGCYDRHLFKKFNIHENHYSIKFLIDNNIINV